jgi:nitroreductase
MDLFEAMKARQSVRAFKPDPVRRAVLLNILENSTYAPSWANSQPWEIFVAHGEALNRLRKKYLSDFLNGIPRKPDIPAPTQWTPAHQHRIDELRSRRIRHLEEVTEERVTQNSLSEANYRFFDAPAVIYLCMHKSLTTWSVFDIGTLAQNIMLAAKDNGLDTVPAYNLVAYPDILRKELNIPSDFLIVIGIAIGYRDNRMPINKFRSHRRPIGEVVRFIK